MAKKKGTQPKRLDQLYRPDLIKEIQATYHRKGMPIRTEAALAEKELYGDWWKCLRYSAEYPPKEEASKSGPIADTYRDFREPGNDFQLWWIRTGNFLFAEQRMVPLIKVVEVDDQWAQLGDVGPRYILLRIPMTIKRKAIDEQLRFLLDQYHVGNLDRYRVSTAKRKMYPRRSYDREDIRKILRVWELHDEHKDWPWWRIGEAVSPKSKFAVKDEDEKSVKAEKRVNMRTETRRMYEQAKHMIANAVRGEFPRYPNRNQIRLTEND